MNQFFSRRKCLYTADVSAGSTIFLKACGNPPESETTRFESIYFKNKRTPS